MTNNRSNGWTGGADGTLVEGKKAGLVVVAAREVEAHSRGLGVSVCQPLSAQTVAT